MVDPLHLSTRSAKRLIGDDRGIAAVEMAFIAPIALLFLGLVVAGGQSLTVYHKTVLATHTVTDLVSRTPFFADPNTQQAELLNESDLDSDLMLSQMVFYPKDASQLQVVMSELKVNANSNQGQVVWSEGCNGGAALKAGTQINLDPSYAAAGATYLLYGQASIVFQPLGVVMSLPPITLSSTDILTIRYAQQITLVMDSKTC